MRKKVLSGLLLCSYLMMLGHQSVLHTHADAPTESNAQLADHHHDDHDASHMEHDFHDGLMHYLSHIFDSIDHSHDNSDDHFVADQDTTLKRVKDKKVFLSGLIAGNSQLGIKVDAESLSSPPYLRPLQLRQKANTPLRAPPSIS